MGKRYLSVAAIALVATVVLVACGSPADEEPEPTVTRIPNPPNAPVVDATPEGEAEEAPASPAVGGEAPDAAAVTIVSHDIFFDPAEFSIPADTPTLVSLPNEGAVPHNYSIDELGISVDLPSGATESVEISAPAGEYEYYCNVPGHKDAGMVGTLVVQ